MKPSKNSKKVFVGILFNVYQWNQKMYDGSYETFEMITRKPQTPIQAAEEELMQETGYKAEEIKLIDEFFGSPKI